MAFLRSLFSGVSALRNHQTMMDVIGNNIANVNTVGFKAGRTTFSELYAQTVQGASRPTATNGGTNPMQVGLGMSVSTIDTLFTAGNIETTAVPFDLAISGQGMFIVEQNGQTVYRYMQAIPTAQMCLNCHGSELSGPVKESLQALYPQDQATGFRAGDLRGAFSLQKSL